MPKKNGALRSLAITAQKGGVSKSTTAVHLAVEASRKKERVLILDTDAQGSCLLWASLREIEHPTVEACDLVAIPKRLERAAGEGYTLAIIDTAPRATATLATALRAVDYVVVPLPPAAFDLGTMEQTLAIISASGRPGCIVLSRCPTRAPEVAEVRASVADLALTLAPVEISERRAYARALASGLAVSEFDSRSAAATEIRQLWNYIRSNMQ
jgi:chromosome partitioning protein